MKYYYTLLHKKPLGLGESVVFTNLSKLSGFIHDEEAARKKVYNKLIEHFSRQKKTWFDDPYRSIVIIKSIKLIVGDQKAPEATKGHSRNFKK